MGTNIDISFSEPLWNPEKFPLILAGPCSAETEEQVLQTARQLAQIPEVKIFRAGLWKPRTRPGSFEGVGGKGLPWLQRVKAETGLKTAVEVAKPEHIEKALEFEIDVLWLGARTVVSPFVVQELAEALKGAPVTVMIKNPIIPDLKLWVGALERINAAGIKNLFAIHRGFHYFEKSPFRNAPMWEIPIELKRLAPQLPIIVDPSHICGRRDLLPEISQKAIDLEMDGLMLEVHSNPDEALTDASQQVSPPVLEELLSRLVLRHKTGNPDFENILETLRTEIDKLDGELLQILAKRMEIIDEIADYKRENNITILQMKRWAGILSDRLSIGTHLQLEETFLKKLLNLIHKESIRRQEKIINDKK
ncbi:bifunctional 3-deoxy-7-phosphoheptulonate synthase/chorismate mutase type II [Candidatus Sulfidibacterium hydrothermale]|uniref:bifunctional 3-deoxy-7-phosphoheptulonate synthase/chorismate mutase type II n=1 Tax=Candidatus Sulfidibacterium hydrothermale TaxID=2875962 RepID=UPI001F0AAFF8|nr:bifunctional 3-deoxy-7-phosphoheptulonate synthase/chorismate mutase type II [Candidatus Sulfidibacterium hydrothermale]UBM62729.1 bifunctional 3-deoxy-7-phosphoheptulonate synthase/chorismate mutase type II [Candidatus Sulfidibacterium hydrothermale]